MTTRKATEAPKLSMAPTQTDEQENAKPVSIVSVSNVENASHGAVASLSLCPPSTSANKFSLSSSLLDEKTSNETPVSESTNKAVNATLPQSSVEAEETQEWNPPRGLARLLSPKEPGKKASLKCCGTRYFCFKGEQIEIDSLEDVYGQPFVMPHQCNGRKKTETHRYKLKRQWTLRKDKFVQLTAEQVQDEEREQTDLALMQGMNLEYMKEVAINAMAVVQAENEGEDENTAMANALVMSKAIEESLKDFKKANPECNNELPTIEEGEEEAEGKVEVGVTKQQEQQDKSETQKQASPDPKDDPFALVVRPKKPSGEKGILSRIFVTKAEKKAEKKERGEIEMLLLSHPESLADELPEIAIDLPSIEGEPEGACAEVVKTKPAKTKDEKLVEKWVKKQDKELAEEEKKQLKLAEKNQREEEKKAKKDEKERVKALEKKIRNKIQGKNLRAINFEESDLRRMYQGQIEVDKKKKKATPKEFARLLFVPQAKKHMVRPQRAYKQNLEQLSAIQEETAQAIVKIEEKMEELRLDVASGTSFGALWQYEKEREEILKMNTSASDDINALMLREDVALTGQKFHATKVLHLAPTDINAMPEGMPDVAAPSATEIKSSRTGKSKEKKSLLFDPSSSSTAVLNKHSSWWKLEEKDFNALGFSELEYHGREYDLTAYDESSGEETEEEKEGIKKVEAEIKKEVEAENPDTSKRKMSPIATFSGLDMDTGRLYELKTNRQYRIDAYLPGPQDEWAIQAYCSKRSTSQDKLLVVVQEAGQLCPFYWDKEDDDFLLTEDRVALQDQIFLIEKEPLIDKCIPYRILGKRNRENVPKKERNPKLKGSQYYEKIESMAEFRARRNDPKSTIVHKIEAFSCVTGRALVLPLNLGFPLTLHPAEDLPNSHIVAGYCKQFNCGPDDILLMKCESKKGVPELVIINKSTLYSFGYRWRVKPLSQIAAYSGAKVKLKMLSLESLKIKNVTLNSGERYEIKPLTTDIVPVVISDYCERHRVGLEQLVYISVPTKAQQDMPAIYIVSRNWLSRHGILLQAAGTKEAATLITPKTETTQAVETGKSEPDNTPDATKIAEAAGTSQASEAVAAETLDLDLGLSEVLAPLLDSSQQ